MINLEMLTGTVERVTYFNPENGYSVIKIQPDGKYPSAAARDGTIAVVGTMPEIGVGETVQFTGSWIDDPRYGKQFRAETVTPIMPSSTDGIVAYLSSGLVRGIGPKTAEKIVDHFGDKTIHILDNEPDKLYDIPGIKRELIRGLVRAWSENQSVRQTMIFLQGYGVTSRMAARIHKHYGAETINKVTQDPFSLADEVFGIGFIRADEIARSMGVDADDHNRIRAGLHFALGQMTKDGHTYAPRGELVAKAVELLKITNAERVQAVLSQELFRGDLISDIMRDGTEAIYLQLYYFSERGSAERLRTLAGMPSKIMESADEVDWNPFLSQLAKANEVSLTPQQQGAVQAALRNKVSVLTGGPGTGKTTTLRMVIGALEDLDFDFALASPTGRAAKRLSEATGYPASTIHRLLGYSPQEGFTRDEENPLEIDMLIVDEASMIDILLCYDLLKALRPETHLMLVGDIDQLPSVGAGNVLRDVIDSQIAHVTRLEMIFRQSEDSHIVVNAHRINNGEAPFMNNQSRDFFFFGEEDPVLAAELVVNIVQNRLPSKFGIDPIDDVQVIAPMYRGPIGVNALNEALQKALNGDKRKAEKQIGGRLFRAGDKVMQTRNNYDKEVFNGDIGRITAIDFEDGSVEVVIDGRYIYYDWIETEELMHAYCISTHRSQGSEYPVVVMPLMTQHYMMLQRNLLYTAVTRAKQLVVLVGSRRAVHLAVKNNKVSERYTGLLQRLKA
jgi:exodeoxyribonuclease V alpha subunit